MLASVFRTHSRMRRLSVGAKFNLILLGVFVIGAVASWFALRTVMERQSEAQVAGRRRHPAQGDERGPRLHQ